MPSTSPTFPSTPTSNLTSTNDHNLSLRPWQDQCLSPPPSCTVVMETRTWPHTTPIESVNILSPNIKRPRSRNSATFSRSRFWTCQSGRASKYKHRHSLGRRQWCGCRGLTTLSSRPGRLRRGLSTRPQKWGTRRMDPASWGRSSPSGRAWQPGCWNCRREYAMESRITVTSLRKKRVM